jgi:hypothetical protein
MNVRPQEIARKERIGTFKGRPVIELELKGGYNLVVSPKGNEVEYLGAGPHRAVARHIAKKRNPDLQITALSKADWIDPAHFEHLIPVYTEMTDALNKTSKK